MNPHFKLHRLIIGLLILLAAWPVWRFATDFFLSSGSTHCDFTHADIKSIQNALDMYKLNAGHYPSTDQGLMALVKKPTTGPDAGRWQQIMKRVMLDPWKNPYVYGFPGSHDPTEPEIICIGPDGIEGTADDLSSQSK